MKNNILLNTFWGVLSLFFLNACEDSLMGSVYQTTSEQMLDEYMDEHLGEFLKIVHKSDYRGMLHAYGAYTCLAPTDEAVRKFMEKEGKTIDELTKEEADAYVGYHIIGDTISSARFEDGKMPTPNIRGYYLTTKTESDESGNVYVMVDRKARMVTKDVLLGNGVLHVIDAVLEKPELTLRQQVAVLPTEKYSLFKDLFAEYEEYLAGVMTNDTTYTVYVQSNETFNDEGIHNKAELLVRLKKNMVGIAEDELVKNFLAYHIGIGRRYIVDLLGGTSAVMTKVENQVITSTMDGQSIVLNRFKSASSYEAGIELLRNSEYTDLTCEDGVMQEVGGLLEIKIRSAYRVDFDMCDLPQIKSDPAYRKETKKFKMKDLNQDVKFESDRGSGNPDITYGVVNMSDDNPSMNLNQQYVNGDYLTFSITTGGFVKAFEFTLPLLIDGTYKVWLCYCHSSSSKRGPILKTTFKQENRDDQVLEKTATIAQVKTIVYEKDANGKTKQDFRGVDMVNHAEMEREYGWKQYTYKPDKSMNSILLGTIKVYSSGRHTIRFDMVEKYGDKNYRFDMIQFIPATENQVWQMLDMKGNQIEEDSPEIDDIWPYK